MRISDWSSDVCSSDLWPPPTASRGTDPRGAARCGWPNQLVTAHRPTIVVGDAMRAAAIGGLTRTPVDHPAALTIVVEHLDAIERHRAIALGRFEPKNFGFSARVGIAANDGAIEDGDAIGIEALNAEIERSGLARRLDTRFDEAEIFVEDGVLERDAQREDAVEPALDRRKVFGKPAGLALQIERSEEHTSELQSLMRISYAVFCLKKKTKTRTQSRSMIN